MNFNSIKIILRRLSRSKAYVLTNIFGLSVGISTVLLIGLIINFNLSFDNYHPNAKRVYRLAINDQSDGDEGYDTGIPFPLRETFSKDFAEVEYFAMIDANSSNGLISIEENGSKSKFDEESYTVAFVQPDYFEIFKYQTLAGNLNAAMTKPGTAVITKKLAEKYFNDYSSAVGKVVTLDNLAEITIGAVINNPPLTTDLPTEFFISFSTFESERVWESWSTTSSKVNAFIRVKEGVDIAQFESKIKNYIIEHLGENDPSKEYLILQPLADLHHSEVLSNFSNRTMSKSRIYALALIGFLLLATAAINFINLTTAQAIKRSKEIGVRKVLGSGRFSLIMMHLKETAIITLISILISLGLVEIFMLNVKHIIGYDLPTVSYDFFYFGFLAVVFALITLTSGIYPAIIIAGYQPIKALKQSINSKSTSRFSVRKLLILFQLFITQGLIIAVLTIYMQVDFFMSQPIGIDSEAVVEFKVPAPDKIDINLFQQRLRNLPGVKNASFSNTGTASSSTWGGFVNGNVNGEVIDHHVQVKLIDPNYIDTYGLNMSTGRSLLNTDTVRRFLLNEQAVKELGFESNEDAIGTSISVWGGQKGDIVGVLKDFSTMSLHYQQEAAVFFQEPSMLFRGAVKLDNGDWEETIAQVQETWEGFFPDFVFSYSFLDDDIATFYEEEQRLANTFTTFSIVAVIIGSVGLLGLMSFLVEGKMKELGIRKVLGAKISQLLVVISSDFVLLTAISFALIIPVTRYFLDNWLATFAQRITLGFELFAIAFVISIGLTIITIAYKSINAALLNPAEVLKDE